MPRRKVCIAQAKTKTRKKQKPVEEYKGLVTFILISDLPGYRMKSYGPAPLLNIKKRKLIDYQIKAITESFINPEIVLCVGFESDKITKYIRQSYPDLNIRIVENQLFNQTNSCESLRLCLNNTNNHKVFVIDGSVLFKKNTLNLHDINEPSICVEKENKDCFDIGVNIDECESAAHFSFGANRNWSEILYLSDKYSIDSLRKIISMENFKRKFVFEALNELIKTHPKIKTIYNKYSIYKINNIKTYHDLR
tara:strand:+ start:4414 stop:5166 length:753 start_codon:yes stop_codon:yes gene_type:complete